MNGRKKSKRLALIIYLVVLTVLYLLLAAIATTPPVRTAVVTDPPALRSELRWIAYHWLETEVHFSVSSKTDWLTRRVYFDPNAAIPALTVCMDMYGFTEPNVVIARERINWSAFARKLSQRENWKP